MTIEEHKRKLDDLASEISEAEGLFQDAVYRAQAAGYSAELAGSWGHRVAVVSREPT